MIRIDKWTGLVTNASQYALPPGSAVEQVNLQCISPGQLTVRSGLKEWVVSSGVSATGAIIRAVRYESAGVEQLVFQDASGLIYASGAAATISTDTTTPPGKPTLLTVVPGNQSIAITVAAPAGSVTGYSYQISSDGAVTWSGAGSSASTSFVIDNLANGSPYHVRVAAVWPGGVGDYSDAFGPVSPRASSASPASAPPLITASASAPLTATVLWQQPASDGGSPITGYRLQASSDGGSAWATVATPAAGVVSATVGSLTAGTSYVFRVAAVTAVGVGQNSASSNSVVISAASAPPSEPRNASGVPSTTSIVLSWQAPESSGSAAIIDYAIKYASGGVTQTATATGTTFTLTGLSSNTAYSISIAARSSAGTGAWANLAPVTTQATPANTAPSSVQGLAVTRSASGFTASWSAPAATGGSAILEYILSTATASAGPYTTRSQGSGTTATVTGLTAGTLYYVRVVARNAVGTSDAADATVTPGAAPSAPLSPAVSFFSSAGQVRARVTWSAPSSLSGVPVLYYNVTASSAGAVLQTLQVSGNATTAELPATVGLSYSWAITAVTALGEGSAATVAQTVTDPDAKPLPSEPRSVVAVPANGSLTVTWDVPSYAGTSAIASYIVTATGRPAVTVQASAERKLTIAGLTNGTSYIVSVQARNLSGTGPAGASEPVIPFSLASAPGSFSALSLGSGYWLLRWNAPTSLGGLQLLRYGIRTNVGISGPFSGGAGLLAEVPGVRVVANGPLSYVYRSTLPGAFASDGTKAGRFDIYAITSAGEGAIASSNQTVPEPTAPQKLPITGSPVVSLSSSDLGVVAGNVRVTISGTWNAIWDLPNIELQWSYDGITYFDAPAGSVKSPTVTPGNLYDYAFSFSVPYSAAADPTGAFRSTVRFRARPIAINRYAAEIPYTAPSFGSTSAAVTYGAPRAPEISTATRYTPTPSTAATSQAVLAWLAPADGGIPITGYTLDIQNPSTFQTTTHSVSASTLSFTTDWFSGEGLRWRVGAINPAGTTYSEWQYRLADADVLLATVSVPGSAVYETSPLNSGLVLTPGNYRLHTSGRVNYGFYSSGPKPASSGPFLIGGGLKHNLYVSGSPGVWSNTGDGVTINTITAIALWFGVDDDTPLDNTGAFTVTVTSVGRTITAPRLTDVAVNQSTVRIRIQPPVSTQGLTLTQYELQSSLNKSSWTTVLTLPVTSANAASAQEFVAQNQPAGTVYYRVLAASNTVQSKPLDITKNDAPPSAPRSLTKSPESASWIAPEFDGGRTITRYNVQVAVVPNTVGPNFSDSYWRELVSVSGDTLSTPVSTTAPAGATLYVRVAAWNGAQGPWARA